MRENLTFALKAGYSFFYTQTSEIQRAVDSIKETLESFTNGDGNPEYKAIVWDFEASQNPDDVINLLESSPSGTMVIAKNLNWFLKDDYGAINKSLVSYLQNRIEIFPDAEVDKKLFIVTDDSFDKAIPDCLKSAFLTIEFGVPTPMEVEVILNFILDSAKENSAFKMPNKKEIAELVDSALGMTKREVTNAFAYSIVKDKGKMNPLTVQEIRAQEVSKTPGLTIGKYEKTLSDLKGYDEAKRIVDEMIDNPDALGMILLGPAGVGKTHFAQSVAGQYNRLCIEIEFAQMMGDGLVGQAEKAWKKAIDVISANANPTKPIVVFIDEIEKGLAGVGGQAGSTTRDGGTSDRSAAQFLKFMSDGRPKGVYIIATCNNIQLLPAAFIRAERWDCAPIMVDLPNTDEQLEILEHYRKVYNVKGEPESMDGWSGAEIKSVCRLAAHMKTAGGKIKNVERFIIPTSKTAEQEISYLRNWAKGKTIPATSSKQPSQKRKIRT